MTVIMIMVIMMITIVIIIICDQISDALVDAYLARDPHARCAIETAATTNRVVLLKRLLALLM